LHRDSAGRHHGSVQLVKDILETAKAAIEVVVAIIGLVALLKKC
jgi:hypothetical protein